MRVGKFNDLCFFKSLIVNALGTALLVRIVNEGVCSVFFDLLFHLICQGTSERSDEIPPQKSIGPNSGPDSTTLDSIES